MLDEVFGFFSSFSRKKILEIVLDHADPQILLEQYSAKAVDMVR